MRKIITIITIMSALSLIYLMACEKTNETALNVSSEETMAKQSLTNSAFRNTLIPDQTLAVPNPPTNITISLNNGVVYIEWKIVGANDSTKFKVTPIYVKGKTQTRLAPSIWGNRFALYSASALQDSAIALGAGNSIKYKFGIQTIQDTATSTETISSQLNL